MRKTLILKPGRDKSVRAGHPWIFSGAVLREEGEPGLGETVLVRASEGEALGWAAYSPHSSIRARMWTRSADAVIGADFFRERMEQALRLRRAAIPAQDTGMRLLHAESDGLPGVVADRYGDVVVMQFLTAGAEAWRETLADLVVDLTGVRTIYERSDVDVRKLEGLPERVGDLRGEAPERVEITESGLRFWVDVRKGQKTGFYLDQRLNRQRVGEWMRGRRVLNCFCYTGAFSVYALARGAEAVLSVDSSAEALAQAQEQVSLNNLESGRAEWVEGDVFQMLRKLRDRGESFDAVILDPPKFAPTAAQAEKAARGYKDINLLGFKLLRPGGVLATFSCSGGIGADLFQKIIAGAAADAGVRASMVGTMTQGPDHPVGLEFPEGAYLKGLLCVRTE